MKIEDILRKAIDWKFRTHAENRQVRDEVIERMVLGLGYLAGPVARPLVGLLNKLESAYSYALGGKFEI